MPEKSFFVPVAAVRPSEQHIHGVALQDPYAWLRADNWQEVMRDPDALPADIRRYLEAENDYCSAYFDDYSELQATLKAELRGRLKEDDEAPPLKDGAYAYGHRFIKDGQYPVYFRTDREGGNEVILLDGNLLSKDHDYFKIGSVAHSQDHELIAWSCDTAGSEYYTITLQYAENGETLPDTISDTSGSIVWSADTRTLFYTRLDDNHRPNRVFRHQIGLPTETDVLIYEEHDPSFFVSIGLTQSGAYVVIDVHDHQTSEVRVIDANAAESNPVLISERETGHEYSLEHRGDEFFILTNKDGAEDFKIVTCLAITPNPDTWQDLVDHRAGRLILSHTTFKDHLVWLERENGLPSIVIYSFDTQDTQNIAFDEEAYSLGLIGSLEFETDELRFVYSSMTTPQQMYDFNIVEKTRQLIKSQEVPSGHESTDYVTRRVFATADDGEEIPISLLHHKDTAFDGTAPCLLYGYGAYGISIPASFSTNALSLADRGFVYAIAHVRGGMDKGYRWYRKGRHKDKVNTFTDFITAANDLEKRGFIDGRKIIAQGGSAGGMLMGAIANIAPNRFAGIIAEVPFVDVLNTMLDDTLPLTPPEWPEWGNPILDRQDFDLIGSYSPYDNVAAKAYPDFLVVAGLTDPRVTYWEPAKWVARLRDRATNDPRILFDTNMGAGHGGASGRFDRLDEIARNWIFALNTVAPNE